LAYCFRYTRWSCHEPIFPFDFSSVLRRCQVALLGVEGLTLKFTDDALSHVAAVAVELNRSLQNIGARRLSSVVEAITSEMSYTAPDQVAQWTRDHPGGEPYECAPGRRQRCTRRGRAAIDVRVRQGCFSDAGDIRVRRVEIDKAFVEEKVAGLYKKTDLTKYLL
jgi:ATP-dependent protease HslVU (ClpYQ) ATPase subunit